MGFRAFLTLAVALAGLAACGQPPTSTTTAPDGGELVPLTPRFVGRWAADTTMCSFGVWEFRADGVSTAGEVSCSFTEVRSVPGGYDVDAICTAQATPTPSQIHLRFPGAPGAMTVDGGPWQPIGLVECPVSFGTPTTSLPAP